MPLLHMPCILRDSPALEGHRRWYHLQGRMTGCWAYLRSNGPPGSHGRNNYSNCVGKGCGEVALFLLIDLRWISWGCANFICSTGELSSVWRWFIRWCRCRWEIMKFSQLQLLSGRLQVRSGGRRTKNSKRTQKDKFWENPGALLSSVESTFFTILYKK